jgi:very-long-chain enoyl-CoA reductase
MFTAVLQNRKGKELGRYQLNFTDELKVLREQVQKALNVGVNRQRYVILNEEFWPEADKKGKVKKPAMMDDSKTFEVYGITEDKLKGAVLNLEFKDMGPQVGWQTVFLLEYFGPLPMHAIPYFLPQLVYGEPAKRTPIQTVAFALVVIHYLKREFESLFVHRFSNATMPFMNIFKNCTHYWLFGGVFISYFLYHPRYTDFWADTNVIYGLSALMLCCEIGNLVSHVTLRNLRPPGTKKRGIPRGQMFELVSCANYTWELGSWFWFAILTQSVSSWVFLLASSIPMYMWAQNKHNSYRKQFADYPKSRKSNIPFLL